MSYPRYLASTVNGRDHGPATATGQDHHEYPPAVIDNLGGTPGTVGWFMNPETLSVAADRVDHWAIDLSLGCNMAPRVEVMRVQGLPADYTLGSNAPYTRRTKTGRRANVSGPPQIFEGSPYVLATRLAYEGADPDAVDLIRCVIFVVEVTEKALTAPIKSRKLSLKYGGVRRNWHLLLQVIEIAGGVKSYCCRLCPQERRPEYKNAADGLRHLKRDHFGMSVACQYW